MVGLLREEIVGHKVNAFWQSPWQDYGDVFVARAWMELDSLVLVGLLPCDPDDTPVLPRVNAKELALDSLTRIPSSTTNVVIEVVSSWYWPSVGILFGDGTLAYMSDHQNPRHVGLEFSAIGAFYGKNDIVTFCGKIPIT